MYVFDDEGEIAIVLCDHCKEPDDLCAFMVHDAVWAAAGLPPGNHQ